MKPVLRLFLLLALGSPGIGAAARPQPVVPKPAGGGADIAGQWESGFGPVTLEVKPGTAGSSTVSGFWQQGAAKRGRIKDGSFDPGSGVLEFAYYQDWNQQNGTARFLLSPDRKRLQGTLGKGAALEARGS